MQVSEFLTNDGERQPWSLWFDEGANDRFKTLIDSWACGNVMLPTGIVNEVLSWGRVSCSH